MTDAVIVSTARTPIGKAYRGALNATEGATLLGHAIGEAVARAKVDPKEIEDVVMGAALQQGATGGNIARKALLRAGLPVTVGGTTIDRQCASGLQAIALAARSVIFDGVEIAVGGGGEFDQPGAERSRQQVSRPGSGAAQDQGRGLHADDRHRRSRWPSATAFRARRQDEYSLESQRRTAAAQQGGKFNDELAPITTKMGVADKATGDDLLQGRDAVARTKARARTPRPKASPASSRCAAKVLPSPPAMPASSRTAPAPRSS